MNIIDKLENPLRVTELNPPHTLCEIGLKNADVFCDIGAGTGLFTFAAAKITSGIVYAVDTSQDMLKILQERNSNHRIKIENTTRNIPNSTCDMALLCTVLHEIDDKQDMINEIRRVLKANGTLAVIEFHTSPTIMGPPLNMRISEEETVALLTSSGFIEFKRFSLSSNLYCFVAVNVEEE